MRVLRRAVCVSFQDPRRTSHTRRTFGAQSGVNSPPAPCLDFTAMSSAISLVAVARTSGRPFLGRAQGKEDTYYCSCRRSSLSFPTSARSMRTSLARALLKSFKYLRKQTALGDRPSAAEPCEMRTLEELRSFLSATWPIVRCSGFVVK